MVLVTLRLPQDVFDTYCHRGHRLRVPLQRVLRGVLIAGARPKTVPHRTE
ncbi:MAG: hypothetical protein Q8T13_23690 [Acidobacteriota bacterium]|nr:hypothetical protein [Acidobacteriota bacterium]